MPVSCGETCFWCQLKERFFPQTTRKEAEVLTARTSFGMTGPCWGEGAEIVRELGSRIGVNWGLGEK